MSGPNLLVGALVAVVAAFAGLQASAAIEDAVPEGRWLPGITVPGVTTPQGTVPGVTTPERPAPERRSPARRRPGAPPLREPLYRPASFREVLRRLRAAGATRLTTLRVDADDVVALAEGRGRRIVVLVRVGFQRTVTTPRASPQASFALSRVRAGVPASLVRRVTRRTGRGIEYVVASRSPIEGRPYWLVFLRGGAGFWRAEMDGTRLRRQG